MSRRIVRYESATTLRYCDECGARYRATELVQGSDKLFRCRQFCVERTMIDVDRAAASAHRLREAPPPPFGQNYGLNETWMSEEFILRLVVDSAPRASVFPSGASAPSAWGASDIQCAAESALYLYGLVAENKRPSAWLGMARAKLRSLADYLLAQQNTTDLAFSGSFDFNTYGFSLFWDEARAALAVLRAYQVFGKPEYLASARFAARWIVNAQSLDKLTFDYTVASPGATGRYLYGAMPVSSLGSEYNPIMYPQVSFATIEFLKLLIDVDGDATYGDNHGAAFSSNPAKLASVARDEIRAFWSTPQNDASRNAAIVGFSSEYMFSYWAPSTRFAPDSTWNGSSISGQAYAWALRSLHAYEGNSSQVADVYGHLMTFTSDPAFAANYAAYEQIVAESNQGTWNPRYGLCEYMSQSTKMNIVAKYLPSSAGCLAPLMDKTSLDYVKQNVGTVAFVDASNLNAGTTVPVFFYYTGLSFQTYGQVALSVIDAAMFGNVYRYAQFYGSTN